MPFPCAQSKCVFVKWPAWRSNLKFLSFIQFTANPELLVNPLKVVVEERINDAPKSNSEVCREDRENDTSNSNSEVLKDSASAAAHNIVALSLSQGNEF